MADVNAGKVTAHKKGSTTITATVAGFSADYEIIVGECTVRFLDADGNELKTVSARYGSSIPADDFPQLASTAEKQFIGWYTKKDGQGTQFDPDTLVYADTVVLYPYFEEQEKDFMSFRSVTKHTPARQSSLRSSFMTASAMRTEALNSSS